MDYPQILRTGLLSWLFPQVVAQDMTFAAQEEPAHGDDGRCGASVADRLEELAERHLLWCGILDHNGALGVLVRGPVTEAAAEGEDR